MGIAVLIPLGLVAYAWARRADVMLLSTHGPIAHAERSLIVTATLLCTVVAAFVFILLFLFAWRYHDEHPDAAHSHHPTWDHDPKWAEVIWWLVPAAIVFALSIILLRSTYALDPYKQLSGKDEITVQVLALDWKWLFIYPEQGVATVNELRFPAGAPVRFYLCADAPMNGFWIPKLGGMIMVMPGMTTQLNLVADAPGEYEGFSSNISGEGFAGMAFTAHALSREEFDMWARGISSSTAPALTREAYEELAKPSAYHQVEYFSSVHPSLFDAVSMKGMLPPQAVEMLWQRGGTLAPPVQMVHDASMRGNDMQ